MPISKPTKNDAILAHKYFSRWYYVAIREMAETSDFQLDAEWISQQLEYKVPLTDIREAIQFLIKYKYIIQTENSTYTASHHHLECEGSIYRLALTEFYKQTYDLCVESIFQTPSVERHLASHTATLSELGFQEVKTLLADTITKLKEITTRDKSKVDDKRVYHISLASFPTTKKVRSA